VTTGLREDKKFGSDQSLGVWQGGDGNRRRRAVDFSVLAHAVAHSPIPVGQDCQKLTPRQRQVLAHLLEGVGEKWVANRLQISFHTVHAHVRQIYLAFDVHSLTELMASFLDRRDLQDSRSPGGRISID
jgi:DNA-binding NarL/FixJ family response regulator